MSEVEQANGIEIPDEVLRAGEGELWVDFGLNVQGIEEAIRAALDALGATVEREASMKVYGDHFPGARTRIVTPWREVP